MKDLLIVTNAITMLLTDSIHNGGIVRGTTITHAHVDDASGEHHMREAVNVVKTWRMGYCKWIITRSMAET